MIGQWSESSPRPRILFSSWPRCVPCPLVTARGRGTLLHNVTLLTPLLLKYQTFTFASAVHQIYTVSEFIEINYVNVQ